MSRLRRWFVPALVVLLAVVAVRLGIWQLDRLAQRRASNAVLLAARDLPPVDLGAAGIRDSNLIGRRVRARGQFRDAGTMLLRNRAFRDAPGVEVVTPFEIEGSGAVAWVLRGFVNAANGVTPRFPLPDHQHGLVELTGVAAAIGRSANQGQPLVIGPDTTWQRLDADFLAARIPRALPMFVYLESADTVVGGVPTVTPPSLDEGPHLSYALQWFGIAIAILTFGLVVVRPRGGRGPVPPPRAP